MVLLANFQNFHTPAARTRKSEEGEGAGKEQTVEREPAKPDERRPNSYEKGIVRLEVDDLQSLAGTVLAQPRPEHQTPRQSAESAGDVHGTGAGKVVHPQPVQPAVGVPLKVREHVVDKGGPAEEEEHRGPETAALEHRAGQDHRRRRHKGEAEARVQDVRDVRVGERRLREHVVQPRQRQVAEHRVGRARLVQRVAVDPELNAAGAGAEEGLEDHGQGRFASVHSGVEVSDGRGDLPAEDGAHKDPA